MTMETALIPRGGARTIATFGSGGRGMACLQHRGHGSALAGLVLAWLVPGCPAGDACVRNSDCAVGAYCSAGSCVTDCTPATVEDVCDPAETCSSFGMCVGGAIDGGAVDVGPGTDAPAPIDAPSPADAPAVDAPSTTDAPGPVDAGSDAPDLRPACVIAGGVDADGDRFCAAALTDADCDDADAAVSPDAPEVCTPSTEDAAMATDENCDGAIDEGCAWHFGTPHPVLSLHAAASGFYETAWASPLGDRLYLRGYAADRTTLTALQAARTDRAAPFAAPTPVPNTDFTLYAIHAIALRRDELEIIVTGRLLPSPDYRLYRATRTGRDAVFGALQPLRAGGVAGYSAAFSADGLEIFFEDDTTSGSSILRASRTALDQPFGAPTPVVLPGTTMQDFAPWLADDGVTLFFNRRIAAGDERIMRAIRSAPSSTTFGTPVEVTELSSMTPARAFQPKLSEATREVFFISNRAWSPTSYSVWRAEVCRDAPCPNRAIACATGDLSPDGLHCYVEHTTPLNEAAARAACVAESAHLATIHSDAENTLVFTLLNANAWLGGENRAGGAFDDYVWITGEPWIFSAWAGLPGTVQPANLPGEDWAGYWTGASSPRRWGDWPQAGSGGGLRYVCEREAWPTW